MNAIASTLLATAYDATARAVCYALYPELVPPMGTPLPALRAHPSSCSSLVPPTCGRIATKAAVSNTAKRSTPTGAPGAASLKRPRAADFQPTCKRRSFGPRPSKSHKPRAGPHPGANRRRYMSEAAGNSNSEAPADLPQAQGAQQRAGSDASDTSAACATATTIAEPGGVDDSFDWDDWSEQVNAGLDPAADADMATLDSDTAS